MSQPAAAGDWRERLIVFYDNAQNIYGVPTPTWDKLGVHIVGRTVFLGQCLRNTRETLALAFNVLTGSFAGSDQRVTIRAFADVASLRQRGLIEEKEDRIEVHFAPRSGPFPAVCPYTSRQDEIDGTARAVRHLILNERVLPSDILILYRSHYSYQGLARKLEQAIGSEHCVRRVDGEHSHNKRLPLLEDGVLTVSTVASAKGYDAPVVFLLGADEFPTDSQGRASFYVGATRAKLHLVISGLRQKRATLLDEVVLAAEVLNPSVTGEPEPRRPLSSNLPVKEGKTCRRCGSARLHAQHGKFGYFYRCIDCAENTPMDWTCTGCGKKARIRKAKDEFTRECQGCGRSEVVHTNVPLSGITDAT